MMAKIFNDDSWTPKVRYPEDEHLLKVNPNDDPITVTPTKLKQKLNELRGVYSRAEKNWKRSGSGSADVEDFWEYSKKDNKGYHWCDVYYLHRLHMSGEFVDVTTTLVDAIPESSIRDTSTGGDMSCMPQEETDDTATVRQRKRSRSSREASHTYECDPTPIPSPSPVPLSGGSESDLFLTEKARKFMCEKKAEEAAEMCLSIRED
eukprot:367510-Hanusia_phi.AAC.1